MVAWEKGSCPAMGQGSTPEQQQHLLHCNNESMKAQLAQLTRDAAVYGDGSCQGKYEVGTRGIAVKCSYSNRHLNFYPEKSRYYGGGFAAELGSLELLSPIIEVPEPPSKPRWASSCEGTCFSGSEGASAAQSWVDAAMHILISAVQPKD